MALIDTLNQLFRTEYVVERKTLGEKISEQQANRSQLLAQAAERINISPYRGLRSEVLKFGFRVKNNDNNETRYQQEFNNIYFHFLMEFYRKLSEKNPIYKLVPPDINRLNTIDGNAYEWNVINLPFTHFPIGVCHFRINSQHINEDVFEFEVNVKY